jgi:hypothetical protein
VTGGFRSSLHQLRGTKVKREPVKLDRQTIHVKTAENNLLNSLFLVLFTERFNFDVRECFQCERECGE